MLWPIAITFTALALVAALLPTLWRRWQAYLILKSDLKSINQWAEMDAFEKRRIVLVSSIYRQWPKAIVVHVEPGDPITYEQRLNFAAGRIELEPLLRIFRARPAGVQITLDARQHKMEICEARAFHVAISVVAAPPRPARLGRPGPEDSAMSASSPMRHGRRDERPAAAQARANSARRP